MANHIKRRRFLLSSAAAAAVGPALARDAGGGEGKNEIFVVHGTDPVKMLRAGIEKMGGWDRVVQEGKKVTVKPNAAWASRPEQGGNTDPHLVGECVAACLGAGASEVVVPEKPCSPAERSFPMSGIDKAVEKAGGRMYAAENDDMFSTVSLPQARVLDKADVIKDVLDTGCLINMPVAKSHRSAVLTLSMKNWMGVDNNRRMWHRKGLHQCIADFSTFIKPSLIIVDATRIMLTKGPRGPGELAYPNQIIIGRDPVAVDAYAATLFKKEPFSIDYIKIAHEMGVGCGDLDKVSITELKT